MVASADLLVAYKEYKRRSQVVTRTPQHEPHPALSHPDAGPVFQSGAMAEIEVQALAPQP
jgi:hypothetical protein